MRSRRGKKSRLKSLSPAYPLRVPVEHIPTPLEEFLAEVEPEEIHDAIVEFQTNWCDHRGNVDEPVSNPGWMRCLDCNIFWPKGQKPKKGVISDGSEEESSGDPIRQAS